MNLIKQTRTIITAVILIIMSGSLMASASLAPLTTPPVGGYNIADILDPGCTPGATDCFVKSVIPTGGTAGQVLSTTGGGVYTWSTPTTGWGLTGNAGTTAGTNFIGTTDAQDVVFKTNNTERLRITQAGRLLTNSAEPSNVYIGNNVGNEAITAVQNTVVGSGSLTSITTGAWNTAIGNVVLPANTTGILNVGVGAASLLVNTTGNYNTAIGVDALRANTTGTHNVGLGYRAGRFMSTGSNNIAIGHDAQVPNGTLSNQMNLGNIIYAINRGLIGVGSVGIGTTTPNNKLEITHGTAGNSGLRFTNFPSIGVLATNATGDVVAASQDPANGLFWGLTGNSGTNPTTNFIGTTDAQDVVVKTNNLERWRVTSGRGRLLFTDHGFGNLDIGIGVGNETMTGILNTNVGSLSGRFLTTGSFNTALGHSSMRSVTTGSENIAIGYFAQRESVGASQNIGVGVRALYFNQGNLNTSIGHRSGEFVTTGSNNITIGANTNVPTGTASNQMNIGNLIYGTGMSGSLAGNIGIGTIAPGNKLEITQGTAGNSGLRFTNLLSTSAVTVANGKSLTVNAVGDVILTSNGGLQWYAENTTGPSLPNTPPIATGAGSIAIGANAEALASNMVVFGGGQGATNAERSNFIGLSAGNGATNAAQSNFIGNNAGQDATDALDSNFIGTGTGIFAANASKSNFLGEFAGENALNASYSNFLGAYAGNGAASASYSNLFGFQTGHTFAGNNIGSNNIIIGTNISLPNAAANSMNIGGVLFGTGFYSTVTGNPSIAPVSTGRIGIGNVAPSYLLHVGSSAITSGTSVARFENAGGTCTVTPNTAGGITCTSDIRFKKDITDVSNTDTLSKLTSLDIKSYRMTADSDNTEKQIGFIAQNVETVFPHLVMTDTDGRKAVSYAGFAPVIVSAIKELSMKVDMAMVSSGNTGGSIMESIANWLGDRANGIKKLVVKDEICIDDVCMTKEDLRTILQNNHVGNTVGSTGTTADTGVTVGQGSVSGSDTVSGDVAGGSAGADTTDTTDADTTTTDTSSALVDSSTTVVDTTTPTETVITE